MSYGKNMVTTKNIGDSLINEITFEKKRENLEEKIAMSQFPTACSLLLIVIPPYYLISPIPDLCPAMKTMYVNV